MPPPPAHLTRNERAGAGRAEGDYRRDRSRGGVLAAPLIAAAAVEATARSMVLFARPNAPAQLKVAVRLQWARWLAMALEFELAADILSTAVTPTWTDIGKLAAVAALRTALNYSLEREIDQESRPDQQAAERTMRARAKVATGEPAS